MTSASEQFAKNPEQYRDNKIFAAGKDLEKMKHAVKIPRIQTLLDIGAAAGHTAIAFADIAEQCVGIDVTPEMVKVANQFAKDKGVENVHFQVGDVESLPFEDETFCVVTCRFAAHHFPQIEKAMKEISRVLKPGGVFLLVDHYAPDNQELDRFINEINQTRDPSQVREYSLSEWKELIQKNELTYEEIAKWDLPLQYDNWVSRSSTPEAAKEKLQHLFQSASPLAKDTFSITYKMDGSIDTFCLKSILVRGAKKQ
ncbi:class I SAM-dependent methyltransferase [Shimazuella sp. AN120528]|uniref:class I SAM-dependent methyltransferase n=1 Tax=Shimazuella soli TaxID=1892854 RepID=UPI001F0FAA65|nr:class I SAM-dependent methyltransferase [Shimazuella soli]MCH5585159.1 class I SAM-dependent methyltransferase [Shimazuella soli]